MQKKKYTISDSRAYKEEKLREQLERQSEKKKHRREHLTKLELNTTYIDNIMKNYILPRNKEISYTVYKAKKTNSIYLKLTYRRAESWLRFSDHETKHNIESISNGNQDVDPGDIINTIQNKINGLSYKSKMMAFESIEKGLKK